MKNTSILEKNTNNNIENSRTIIHNLNNKLQILEYNKYIISNQIEWLRNHSECYSITLINEELISKDINDSVSEYRILPYLEKDNLNYYSFIQFYFLDDGVKIYSPNLCNIGITDIATYNFSFREELFIKEAHKFNINEEVINKIIKEKEKIEKYIGCHNT